MTVSYKLGASACAGALLAGALVACGGGGGGDTPPGATPPATTGGASAAGYYTVAESRTSSTAPSTLHVVDPADPTHPKLSVTIDGQGRQYHRRTTAASIDDVAHTVRVMGEPLLIYVKAGALYKVDLRATGNANAIRISSESHACEIADLYPVEPSGYISWVEVRTAGADGSCTATADNRTTLIRTDMPAATSGTVLPTTSTMVGSFGASSLTNAGRLLILESASASTKLRLYSADLVPGNYVAGSDGANAIYPLYGSTAVGKPERYYIVDKQLKQFTTDGITANLSSSLYTFTTASVGVVHATGEATSVYFADDAKVMRVSGASSATQLATLNTTDPTYSILWSPTHLVFSQGKTISAVPKSGGTVTTLKTGLNAFVLNVSGSKATYFLSTGTNAYGELRSINTNGTGDALIEGGGISCRAHC